ncbi:Phosphatidylinositol 4-phosphate 5-kinase 8 [Diplonema papillatum]|nr:Phosphatidylinositol 4-phosphate 5-kinase 8 [Diplonema papillatum]
MRRPPAPPPLLLLLLLLAAAVEPGAAQNATSLQALVRRGIQKCVGATNSTGANAFLTCPVQPVAPYIADRSKDVDVGLTVLGSLFVIWCVGWVLVGKFTVDDGYIDAPRSAESDDIRQRKLMTYFVLFVESPQLCAICFSSAMEEEYTMGMSFFQSFTAAWLLRWEGGYLTSFSLSIGIAWILGMVVYAPVITAVLFPGRYAETAEKATAGVIFGIETARDFYLHYLPLPLFVNILSPFFCTYYEEPPNGLGEDPTVNWDRSVTCWDPQYYVLATGVALLTFFMYWGSCLASGMIPFLVQKSTDLLMHGRYTATSIQMKLWLASFYLMFEQRWRWPHLAGALTGLFALAWFNVSIRPCCVEKINYVRTCGILLALWVCIANIYTAAMDDPTANSPFWMVTAGTVALAVLCLVRYCVIPETKVFPPVSIEGGFYEGDVALSTMWRHGTGFQKWPDKAEYVGSWLFDSITGKGVFKLPNGMFYEGQWLKGKRHGFGKTTIVDDGEMEYEGFFSRDLFHGFGTKRFDNGEVYEGGWKHGKEHGLGQWSFADGSTVYGTWVEGTVTFPNQSDFGFAEDEPRVVSKKRGTLVTALSSLPFSASNRVSAAGDEDYNDKDTPETRRKKSNVGTKSVGPIRYGVLHGEGTRYYAGGGVYKGTFRAGMRHGDGIMQYDVDAQYMGVWLNDKRHGDGSFEHPDWQYEGDWQFDMMHGHGKLTLTNGETYTGHFRANKRDGYGRCEFRDGREFIGSFTDNEYSGKGSMTFSNGDTYEGPWVDGLRHGNPGKYTASDGSWYEGEFAGDEADGEGILAIENIGTYNGTFSGGKKQGVGQFEWSDGSVYKGEWVDNTMTGRGTLSFRSDILMSKIYAASVTFAMCASQPQPEETDDGNDSAPPEPELLTMPDMDLDGPLETEKQLSGILRGKAAQPPPPPPPPRAFNGTGNSAAESSLAVSSAGPGDSPPLQQALTPQQKYEPDGPMSPEGRRRSSVIEGYVCTTFDYPKRRNSLASPAAQPKPIELAVPLLTGIAGGEYDGEWNDGWLHGYGTMIFGDGSQYEGQWTLNRPHGRGVRRYADSSVYEGQWNDGRRQGIGQMVYPDRRVFVGQWFNDLRHGAGKIVRPNSKRGPVHGYWKTDTFVGSTYDDFLKTDQPLDQIIPNSRGPQEDFSFQAVPSRKLRKPPLAGDPAVAAEAATEPDAEAEAEAEVEAEAEAEAEVEAEAEAEAGVEADAENGAEANPDGLARTLSIPLTEYAETTSEIDAMLAE